MSPGVFILEISSYLHPKTLGSSKYFISVLSREDTIPTSGQETVKVKAIHLSATRACLWSCPRSVTQCKVAATLSLPTCEPALSYDATYSYLIHPHLEVN